MHTTNYSNTFIEVADDCKAEAGTVPPEKAERTIAQIQYELISKNPYRYTSDDVIFAAYAEKNKIDASRRAEERAKYFSKGQACLRASPMPGRVVAPGPKSLGRRPTRTVAPAPA